MAHDFASLLGHQRESLAFRNGAAEVVDQIPDDVSVVAANPSHHFCTPYGCRAAAFAAGPRLGSRLGHSIRTGARPTEYPGFASGGLRHLGGMPWARIGELVGHDDLVTTARTYTHVVVDERQLDYTELLS
jgi:hypothetical protein